MTTTLTYHRGKPRRPVDVAGLVDTIADRLLHDGDVEAALQNAFRLGTEEDIGLLDILDRLREESTDLRHQLLNHDQHTGEDARNDAAQWLDDATTMREQLRQVESLDDLNHLDPELMDRALSTEEREWIEKWADMQGQLIESGLVVMQGSRMRLTARAIRWIGSGLLRHMHLPPQLRGRGTHAVPVSGSTGAPGDDLISWQWGRPFDLDVSASLIAGLRRGTGQTGITLNPDDFVVRDRESGAAYATVLMLDMSRSMFDSGAWDIAKRAAIALDTLNESTHKQDVLKLVGFSGSARELNVVELPSLSWDQFSHGTNLQAGLQIAQQLLKPLRTLNRQIVVVTDGEPTAYQDGDRSIFENPVTERTINATLLEARRATKAGIAITTIAVGDDIDPHEFSATFTRVANGRLIHLPINQLGAFVVHDLARGSSRYIR